MTSYNLTLADLASASIKRFWGILSISSLALTIFGSSDSVLFTLRPGFLGLQLPFDFLFTNEPVSMVGYGSLWVCWTISAVGFSLVNS